MVQPKSWVSLFLGTVRIRHVCTSMGCPPHHQHSSAGSALHVLEHDGRNSGLLQHLLLAVHRREYKVSFIHYPARDCSQSWRRRTTLRSRTATFRSAGKRYSDSWIHKRPVWKRSISNIHPWLYDCFEIQQWRDRAVLGWMFLNWMDQ